MSNVVLPVEMSLLTPNAMAARLTMDDYFFTNYYDCFVLPDNTETTEVYQIGEFFVPTLISCWPGCFFMPAKFLNLISYYLDHPQLPSDSNILCGTFFFWEPTSTSYYRLINVLVFGFFIYYCADCMWTYSVLLTSYAWNIFIKCGYKDVLYVIYKQVLLSIRVWWTPGKLEPRVNGNQR